MEIKKQIIDTAIKILNEEQSLSGVTIRKIAKKAGIGVGLINYHFQTKENLINIAVRTFINSIIAQWGDVVPQSGANSRLDLLIGMFQASAEFMATYPKISRISILNDLNNPNLNDNTMTTLNGVLPILKSYNSPDAVQAGIEAIALLQWHFLRNDIYEQNVRSDFFEREQRNKFVSDLCRQKFNQFENETGEDKNEADT